jgi:hypothetical protein
MRDHQPVHIRAPRAGDGAGLARGWIDAARYYAELAPELFKVPQEAGLAAWLEVRLLNVPPQELILVS